MDNAYIDDKGDDDDEGSFCLFHACRFFLQEVDFETTRQFNTQISIIYFNTEP